MSKFTFGTPTTSIPTTNSAIGFGSQQNHQCINQNIFSDLERTTGLTAQSTPFGSTTSAIGTSGFGNLNFTFGSSQSPVAQTSSSTLGTITNTSGLNLFQTPATITQNSGSTFGTSLASSNSVFGTPVNTSGLTFGTTSASGNSSFGAPITTSTNLTFGTSGNINTLFGSTLGTNFNNAKTSTVPASAVTTTNKGLGGFDISISNKGLMQGSNSPTAVKENLLPKELMQTIEDFKEFVKTQKVLSSDIARGSSRPLSRCAEDTVSLVDILTTLAGSVQRDRSSADKLKQDTAKALQNAEISQRTHDIPPGLQYENSAPHLFFLELAEHFEHDLFLFKAQIEVTEKHIKTMMTPKTLTPQELTMAMGKLHESLVAVAGRLQGVHSRVQQQKEQYLNFRKYVLKDNTNVFEDVKLLIKTNKSSISKITTGPTPFASGHKSFLSSSTINSSQSSSYGSVNPLVWGTITPTPSVSNFSVGTTMKPPTSSLTFNTPVNLTAPLPSTSNPNSNFQLQKPPLGNKRGKF